MVLRNFLLVWLSLALWAPSAEGQSKSIIDPRVKQFNALLDKGQPQEAEKILIELAFDQKDLESDGTLTISAHALTTWQLVASYLNQRDFSSAERVSKALVAWGEAKKGPVTVAVANYLENLAMVYRVQGRYKEAEPYSLRAVSIWRQLDFAGGPFSDLAFAGLAETLLALNRAPEAEELLRSFLESAKRFTIERPPERIANLQVVVFERLNKLDEAAQADRLGAEASLSSDPRFHRQDVDLLRARLLAAQNRFDEAIQICEKWVMAFDEREAAKPGPRVLISLGELENMQWLAGRKEEAMQTRARLKKIRLANGFRP